MEKIKPTGSKLSGRYCLQYEKAGASKTLISMILIVVEYSFFQCLLLETANANIPPRNRGIFLAKENRPEASAAPMASTLS